MNGRSWTERDEFVRAIDDLQCEPECETEMFHDEIGGEQSQGLAIDLLQHTDTSRERGD